ncbi:LysR family transcriptional regulator [Endozoicomonas atrinae]|uniref:LysR family transcriptional regulator n=1 Tax=Endozoicomonas atrinae TaxID=1333660 RepID=UPI000A9499A0|nr:LysR family transcriptional regulator [Endozoicomonas atrinae]
MSKVTLDQWRMFQAVVEHGGFAQASEAIFKSQSTISYAISKLQHQLGIDLLEIQGRKAVLTEAGEAMLRRAKTLLKEADALE